MTQQVKSQKAKGKSNGAWLAVVLLLAAAAHSEDTVLGTVRLPGQSSLENAHLLELLRDDAGKLSLRLTRMEQTQTSLLPLQTPSFRDGALHPDQPLQASHLNVSAGWHWITFGVKDAQGAARSIAALLVMGSDGKYSLAKEWTADSGPVGELGFRREKQSFAAPKFDTLTRQFHSLAVEGVSHKLDCGCVTCNSRTTEIIEDETYVWNRETKSFQRITYEKRYVVQPGEGLMAVARKALGDARLMARLYRLNPEIKPDGVLKEGQKILVERQP